MVHKAVKKTAPLYLQDLIIINVETLHMRDGPYAVVPKVGRNMGQRSFSYAGPTLWNKLPQHTRSVQESDQFKSRLKTHLFNGYFM